jgi:hypothetical protein
LPPDRMGKVLPVAIYLALVRASGFRIFPTTDSLYQAAILNTWNIAQKLFIAKIMLSMSKNVI